MHLPPQAGLRVVRYAEGFGYAAAEWEAALAAVDWRHAAVPLKFADRGSVWLAALVLGGREVPLVLKVEPLETPAARIKSLLRLTKAHRQWRGALRLARVGVRVARPRAVLVGDDPRRELLLLEHVPGPTALEHLRDVLGQPRRERELAEALALLYWHMEKQDAFNNDPKLSNYIVTDSSPPVSLALLDSVAIDVPVFPDDRPRWLRWPPYDHAPDQLEFLLSLLVEPLGCTLTLRLSLRMRMLRIFALAGPAGPRFKASRRAWREMRNDVWHDLAKDLDAHGDPTPRHDPLARPPWPPSNDR